MKPEDDEPSPTDEELREAAALADALEKDARPDAAPPSDAMETASLLRHARAPLTAPREHHTVAPTQPFALAPRSGERVRERGPRRRRLWIAASFALPAAAAAWLLFATTLSRKAPPVPSRPPPPTASLLAAQANATRGGRAALARLDEEMRAYRRQYLRRGEP